MNKERRTQATPAMTPNARIPGKCVPPQVKARVAVEQGSTFGWERYVGLEGRVIGIKTFGASAPLKGFRKSLGSSHSR